MDRTLRKIKRGLWQQEREIIRGLQQRPPVAGWREEMVMALTAGLGHEWQAGWEQSRTQLQVKPNSYRLQLCFLFQGVQRAQDLESQDSCYLHNIELWGRSLIADRHQGFDCFQGRVHISWKTKINPVTKTKAGVGMGSTSSHKILSFFPNDEDKNNYASVYCVHQSALRKEKGSKKEC